MDTKYVAPTLEVIGSVHELTLMPAPGQAKIIGGALDGQRLRLGGHVFPLGYS